MILALLLAFVAPQPRPGTCIADTIHLLSPAEFNTIERQCETFDKLKNGAYAVAIVNDLQGMDRKEYAVALFKAWGVGHKGKDDGVLFLLAMPPADRGLKIEVGYGLEGVLNDGKTGAAFREIALPLFKQKRFGEGIARLIETFAHDVNLEPKAPATPSITPRTLAAPPKNTDTGIWWFWGLLLVAAPLISFIVFWVRRKRAEKREAIARKVRADELQERFRKLNQEREEFRKQQEREEEARRIDIEKARERVKTENPSPPISEPPPRHHRKDPIVVRKPYTPPKTYVPIPYDPTFDDRKREEEEEHARRIRRESEERREEEERRARREREEEDERRRKRDDDSNSSPYSSSSSSSDDSGGGFSGFDSGSSGGGGSDNTF